MSSWSFARTSNGTEPSLARSCSAAGGVVVAAIGFVALVGSYLGPSPACSEQTPLQPLRWPLRRSEEHTYELQSLMRSSYAVFCLKKKINRHTYIETENII